MIVDDPIQAGKCLRDGGIVIFPTETVYGIGASAYDHDACRRIYQLKQRPLDNPLILHLPSIEKIFQIAHIEPSHIPLLQHFFPGSTTFIFKKKDPAVFTAGLKTVAVRIPLLEKTQNMLAAADVPIAAPSANLSGKPSITRFQDAVQQFKNQVDMILKGPNCSVGIESTVVDLSNETPCYLRPGIISFEEMRSFLPNLVKVNLNHSYSPFVTAPISPGLKYRHYAPSCQVIVTANMAEIENVSEAGQIGFNLKKKTALDVQLHQNDDYSRHLYAFFIDCDRWGLKTAYCEYPQQGPMQEALLNRLNKASCKK